MGGMEVRMISAIPETFDCGWNMLWPANPCIFALASFWLASVVLMEIFFRKVYIFSHFPHCLHQTSEVLSLIRPPREIAE